MTSVNKVFADLPVTVFEAMSQLARDNEAINLGQGFPDDPGPPAVLAKLNGEINKVLQHPELKSAFAKIGIAPRGTTPEQAAAFTRSEYEKWKQVIVDGKIKPE